jgi:hypothetical protein
MRFDDVGQAYLSPDPNLKADGRGALAPRRPSMSTGDCDTLHAIQRARGLLADDLSMPLAGYAYDEHELVARLAEMIEGRRSAEQHSRHIQSCLR